MNPDLARDGLPPGPRSPSIVQTLRFLTDPDRFLRGCAARCGDLFTIRLVGGLTYVVVASPALLAELYQAPADVVHAGEAAGEVFGPILGYANTVTLDEDRHLQRRRLVMPPLRGERMHEYRAGTIRATERAVAAWPKGRPFALLPAMQALTLEVIAESLLGLGELPADVALRRQLALLAADALTSPLLFVPTLQWDLGRWSPWGRVLGIVQDTRSLLEERIRRRRREGVGEADRDVLSLLLLARGAEGQILGDDEVCNELLTLLTAGQESTAVTLTWAVAEMLLHPEVESRIRAEVSSVVGDGPIERAHLEGFAYMDRFLREVLRCHTFIPLNARKLNKPLELGGYTLPAGARIAPAPGVVHRRADVYTDPEAFNPERFDARPPSPHEWVAFGGGVRRCVGMAMALYEMKVVLATLVRRARVDLCDRRVVPVQRGFFTHPSGGLLVRLEPARGA